MKLSLKERLLTYINKLEAPIASGELQRIVGNKTSYTPRTTCRRLEELAAEGLIEVTYKKSHAWYGPNKKLNTVFTPEFKKQLDEEATDWFDSLPEKR